MSPEQENFAELRRLLVLKRHEQPPPRFFNDFSRGVIARIRAGERAEESFVERLGWEAPWLRRLWSAFEQKPLLAGAFGVAVCSLLVSGIILSERVEPVTTPSIVLGNGTPDHAAMIADQTVNPLAESVLAVPQPVSGVVTGLDSLFRQIRSGEFHNGGAVPVQYQLR